MSRKVTGTEAPFLLLVAALLPDSVCCHPVSQRSAVLRREVVTLGLLVTYILDTFRNDRVAKDMKALWAVVLFMGSIFAMPIYWYLYVWRDSPPAVAGQPPTAAPNSR